MTTAVLWKEYRQQRALWLSVAGLGILMAYVAFIFFGGGRAQDSDASLLRVLLIVDVVVLTVAYGVVSGALLLAGESEEGTLVFLDNLTGRRSALWARKCLVGVAFTLAQSVVMSVLAMYFGIGDTGVARYLPLLLPLIGLDALAWGLLAGALYRTVLGAVLAGVAMMFASWCFDIIPMRLPMQALVRCTAAAVAAYGSWRVFCRHDIQRKLALRPFKSQSAAPWRVLLWLMIRQGRWILLAGVASAVVVMPVAINLDFKPLVVWPPLALLVGLAFGLAVFAPDQNEGNRFLAAQRLPPGWIWTIKVVFWGLAAALVLALAFGSYRATILLRDDDVRWRGANLMAWFGLMDLPVHGIGLLIWWGIWPLYGFTFGQFFGLIARRPVIGAMLAFAVTPLVVALWTPSMLLGGVPIWQIFIIPLLLLLTTRLVYWPWVSGRLWDIKPLGAIAGAAALMTSGMIFCLWQRADQVPDVGEPFGVEEFLANLPETENLPWVRLAATSLMDYRALNKSAIGGDGFETQLRKVLDQGWPKHNENGWPKDDEKIGTALDLLFKGDWVAKAQKAAQPPLTMVHDPREVTPFDLVKPYQQYPKLALVLSARALQLQAKGDARGGLDQLDTALALSRQVKNYAVESLWWRGNQMESTALIAFHQWLEQTGPNKDLVQAGLALLRTHEAANPDPANSLKAAYVIFRNREPMTFGNDSPLVVKAVQLGSRTPWEKERLTRMLNAITLGSLQRIRKPFWEAFDAIPKKDVGVSDYMALRARQAGLPPEHGPGSKLSALQWGELLDEAQLVNINYDFFWNMPRYHAYAQRQLKALELVTALSLYHMDHKHMPAQLDALVPAYLPAVPLDPTIGKPFGYRLDRVFFMAPASHAIIFSVEDAMFSVPCPGWTI